MARTGEADRPPARTALLPHRPPSVSEARRMLTVDIEAQGVQAEVVEDARLVLSELLANAIRHAKPLVDHEVEVAWQVGDHEVELRVTDGGGGVPGVRHAGTGDTGGRGLAIVDALAEDWGVVVESPGSRTVWAVLSLS